jgi:hypothetical protein
MVRSVFFIVIVCLTACACAQAGTLHNDGHDKGEIVEVRV